MGSSAPEGDGPFRVRKVAVIGAGPSGLAAAKYLLAQGAFVQVVVFEQQAEVGGVWNYSGEAKTSGKAKGGGRGGGAVDGQVPQTDAHPRVDEPVYVDGGAKDGVGGEGGGTPLFPSPMYEDLHTNIPHTLMKYSDLDFPSELEIFPTRQSVQEYLVQYARDVRRVIKFSTQVTRVALRHRGDGNSKEEEEHKRELDQWDVHTRDLLSGQEAQDTYDAVVVASGHYSTPYIPSDIGNIAEFHAAHPGVVSHSKAYRDAAPFRGKKVVVVGTGPSGLDVAAQIRPLCAPPLLLSARTGAKPEMLAHISGGDEGALRQVGEIKRFVVGERGVEFSPHDGGGETAAAPHVERDVDAVVFCTGYLYTFPFLGASLADGEAPLVTDGRRVRGLARHFLHVAHPTLAFPGLPMKIIPFPLAEAQAAVLARAWANVLPLPPRSVLEEWERADAEAGADVDGKYHVFRKGGDGRYINGLHDWVVSHTTRRGEEGGGKEPPRWDEELLWQRSIYVEAKMRFEETGKKARTLEELGFRYEPKGKEAAEEPREADERLRDVAG
ncbi:monooxygenase [Parahypoxylon ruwenzoriense]